MGLFRKSVTDDPSKDRQPTKYFGWLKRKLHMEPVDAETEERQSDVSSQDDSGEIYSTRDKQIRYKNEMPIESEKIRSMQQKRKKDLISGETEINLEGREKIDNVELKTDGSVKVSKDVIETVGKFQNIHSIGNDNADIFDTGEIAKLPVLTNKEKKVSRIPTYRHDSKVNYIKIKAGRFTQVVESEYDQYLINNDPIKSKRQQLQDQIPENRSLIYHLNQVANKYKTESKNEEEREKNQRDIEQQRRKKDQGQYSGSENAVSHKKGTKDQKDPFDVAVVGKRNTARKKAPKDFDNETEQKEGFFAKIGHFFKVIIAMAASVFMSPKQKSRRLPESKKKNDYQDRQDARFITSQIKSNMFTLTVTLILLLLIFAFFFVISVMESREGSGLLSEYTSFAPVIFAGVNFILLILSGIVYRKHLLNGFSSLLGLKGNVDSIVAVAYVSCIIQSITSLIVPSSFMGGDFHIYSILVVAAMFMMTLGRVFIEARVKNNFNFIVSKKPAYVVKTYGDEEISEKMLSGTSARKHNVVYQHETDFLSDFLKISYAPDPSEEICGRMTPVIILISLAIGIIYFIISKDIVASLSAVTAMCCMGIPFSAVVAGNIPLYLFSKRSLKNNAMVSGFPCVREFGNTSGIILRAKDLYPFGSIKLHGIKNYIGSGIDNVILCTGVMLREVDSPLYQVFVSEIRENRNNLPRVESVIYEERLGVVGWINGTRIIIGNSRLMEKYNIVTEGELDDSYIGKGRYVTYIAFGGTLAAEFAVSYIPNQFIQNDLYKAEERGICFVISSTDPNLNHQKITDDYNLYTKSVRVVPIGYSNMCSDLMNKKTLTSRAYLATRGKFLSFCKAVSGCIKIKSNLTMGLIIEIIGIILGIVICAAMVLSAGVSRLNIFNLLLYTVFWIAATLIAELVRRP